MQPKSIYDGSSHLSHTHKLVAPSKPGQPKPTDCGQILRDARTTVALDAAGTFLGAIPGAGAALVTAQVAVGLAGAANSAYHGDVGGTMAGAGGAQLSGVAAGTETFGFTAAQTFGGTVARSLPWIGSAVSGYYFYKNATEALDKYQACKAGIGG